MCVPASLLVARLGWFNTVDKTPELWLACGIWSACIITCCAVRVGCTVLCSRAGTRRTAFSS